MATPGTPGQAKKKRGTLAPVKLTGEQSPFQLSKTGTFTEDGLAINGDGLRIDNEPEAAGAGERVRLNDLLKIKELGSGSGGVVQLARHEPSGELMALKVIPLDVKDEVRKRILFELRTLHSVSSPNVVSFYGAFLNEGIISICMEYMDAGSLQEALRASHDEGVPEAIIAGIMESVLSGLVYLHGHKILHRDLKPHNILLNTKGQVKICDFGVSAQLANTISGAVSWVGTATYMSPERIKGETHGTASDIWSVGLIAVEMAIGRYPYPQNVNVAVNLTYWDLLEMVVKEAAPTIPADRFSAAYCDFAARCLSKAPLERTSAVELLGHPFIRGAYDRPPDMAGWVAHVRGNDGPAPMAM